MAVEIQLRRDTAANWTGENPVLAQGEPGYETDTGKIKYGDGSTAWADLPYAGGGGGGGGDFAVADFTFTEETTAGTYTATLTMPARSAVIAAGYWLESDWAADTALFTIGDSDGNWVEDADVSAGTAYGWNDVNTAYNGNPSYVQPLTLKVYPSGDEVTMTVVTTIGSPPVVGSGVVRARVIYMLAPTPTAATFA